MRTWAPNSGYCNACDKYSPERHLRNYAGGGEDRLAICCDCNDCDADCDGRIIQVCANCGATSPEIPPRCSDARSEFVGGCHVLVDQQDAPRKIG
jgi:hypothetical protein